MSRRRSARSLIAEQLDDAGRQLRWARANWCKVSTTVYAEPEEREHPGQYLRPRREDEYPENDRRQLATLLVVLRQLRQALDEAEQVATERFDELGT